jgi:deoxycytidylate deaminase
MADTAKSIPVPAEGSTKTPSEVSDDLRRLAEIIQDTHTEELILSLCGFIGTDIHMVSKRLKHILENTFDYPTEVIFLSDQIKERYDGAKGMTKENTSYYDYTRTLIEGGNALREKYENAILAELAVQKIAYDRHKEKGEGAAYKPRRRCYIIDSIKNDKELELLRIVYRDIHYAIGVFSSMDIRRRRLSSKQLKEAEIDTLIERDSNEAMPNGQKVRDTFTQSDFFLRLDSYSTDELDSRLERFLHLIFSTKVITPTVEETAMYQASSAAGNSACLSRQVGAALTDAGGEVLSIGWNDVPRAEGGLYTTALSDPLGKNDNRCFNIGTGCWNDKEKNQIAQELVDSLIEEELIAESMRSEAFQKIRKSKIKELVEFSRAVHAEMHAIITGCLHAGGKVQGGMLFVTTYPCHNCARHIIVAGIKKVYYIEPYTKSLTTKLHADAITENEKDKEKVMILMYDGIAPSRYLQLFKMYNHKRKEADGSGNPVEPNLKTAKPKTTLSLEAIPVLEMTVAEQLKRKGLEIKL